MRKRLTIGLAAGLLAAAMLPGVASAIGSPGDKCPKEFALSLASNFEKGPKTDQNADGWVCFKPLPEPVPGDFGTIIDNAARR